MTNPKCPRSWPSDCLSPTPSLPEGENSSSWSQDISEIWCEIAWWQNCRNLGWQKGWSTSSHARTIKRDPKHVCSHIETSLRILEEPRTEGTVAICHETVSPRKYRVTQSSSKLAEKPWLDYNHTPAINGNIVRTTIKTSRTLPACFSTCGGRCEPRPLLISASNLRRRQRTFNLAVLYRRSQAWRTLLYIM